MKKFNVASLLLFSMNLLLINVSFASDGRYPAGIPIEPKQKVTCLCDTTTDPCCVPPPGNISTVTKEETNPKNTDTAKCKCDPKKDPCCKGRNIEP